VSTIVNRFRHEIVSTIAPGVYDDRRDLKSPGHFVSKVNGWNPTQIMSSPTREPWALPEHRLGEAGAGSPSFL
jgi:hypothetical protein